MERRADPLSSLLSGGGLPAALNHLSGSALPPMPAAAAHSDNFLGNQFQLPGAALPAAAPTDPHVAALLASLQSQQQQNPALAALNQQQQQLAALAALQAQQQQQAAALAAPVAAPVDLSMPFHGLPPPVAERAPAELAGIPGLPPPPAAAIAPAAIAPAAAAPPADEDDLADLPGLPPPSPVKSAAVPFPDAAGDADAGADAGADGEGGGEGGDDADDLAGLPGLPPPPVRVGSSSGGGGDGGGGKVVYSKEFLLTFKASCTEPPPNLEGNPAYANRVTLGTNLAELKREARALVAQLSDERPPRGERQPGFTPVLNGLSRLVGEVKTRAELNALLDVVFDRAMTTTSNGGPAAPQVPPFAPTPSPPRRPHSPTPPPSSLATAGVRAPDREALRSCHRREQGRRRRRHAAARRRARLEADRIQIAAAEPMPPRADQRGRRGRARRRRDGGAAVAQVAHLPGDADARRGRRDAGSVPRDARRRRRRHAEGGVGEAAGAEARELAREEARGEGGEAAARGDALRGRAVQTARAPAECRPPRPHRRPLRRGVTSHRHTEASTYAST